MANGKMARFATKALAGVLSTAMCVAVIPEFLGSNTVLADEFKNQGNTSLGVSAITSPDKPADIDSDWSGSYVFFGNCGGPIMFRVLAKDSTAQTTKKALFLDSAETLFCTNFDEGGQDWKTSTLRSYLNGDFYEDSFTAAEKDAIAMSHMDGGKPYAENSWEEWIYGQNVGIDDKVFLLDAADVLNESYGYSSDPGYHMITSSWWDGYDQVIVYNRIKKGECPYWWLRNAYADNIPDEVGLVYAGGHLSDVSSYREDIGVAPALCVDQDSIIFTTEVDFYDELDNEFKLTLVDEDLDIDIQENEYITAIDNVVTVPYVISGDNADEVSRVTVLILDGEYTAGNTNGADIIYYDDLSGAVGVDGTGTFELPDTLDIEDWGTAYHVYILAEINNGDRKSDYANAPVEINAPLDGWFEVGEEYYYFDIETRSLKEGWFRDGGNWYYFEYGTGKMVRGWKLIENAWYYFRKSGAMVTGWQKISNAWYYFNKSGKMQTGWLKSGDNWYYLNDNGKMRTGWLQYENAWYYFDDDDGSMVIGWKQIENIWYYFGDDGKMVTGWLQDGDAWYYFDANGKMYTKKWLQDGGKWYYFKDNGKMATGWLFIGDVWYFFGDDGVMRTGWQKIDGEWYYFVSTGYMYWGWLQQGDNWYFLERYKGPMVTGTVVIDGYTFHFADTGEWIPD